MSSPFTTPCPACGALQALRIFESVNASSRRDLQEQLLDGRFEVRTCVDCQEDFLIPADLTWCDLDQGLWVRALPLSRAAAWPEAEAEVHVQYFSTFGPLAPLVAQELGAQVQARVVFGWAALREKVLCAQHGLDDAALEIAKLMALTHQLGEALGDDSEWRLTHVDDERLHFAVLATGLEVPVSAFTMPRGLVQDIMDAPQRWAEVREAVVGEGFFVDVNRALLEVEAAA